MDNVKRYLMEAILLGEDFTDAEDFTERLPERDKNGAAYYHGRMITWFGSPGRMAIVPIAHVEGMWGNIYYQDKIDGLVEKIRGSEDNFELLAPYGFPNEVTLEDVAEDRIAYEGGSFQSEVGGAREEPYTTGDDELDGYLGKDAEDAFEDMLYRMFDETEYDQACIDLMESTRLCLSRGRCTAESLKEKAEGLLDKIEGRNAEDDGLFWDFFEEYKDMEESLLEAYNGGMGDLGDIRIQLRDGHHRAMAAKEVGERYICVDLSGDDKEEIRKAEEAFSIAYQIWRPEDSGEE